MLTHKLIFSVKSQKVRRTVYMVKRHITLGIKISVPELAGQVRKFRVFS